MNREFFTLEDPGDPSFGPEAEADTISDHRYAAE
jgi:hypothetical protein